MKLAALLLASVALIGACNSDEGGLTDVEDVVVAMEDEGIECRGLETTTEFGNASDQVVTERGICLLGEDRVVVSMFDDASERDKWLEDGELVGRVAVGENWVAGSDSPKRVDAIAAALDARIVGANEN